MELVSFRKEYASWLYLWVSYILYDMVRFLVSWLLCMQKHVKYAEFEWRWPCFISGLAVGFIDSL